MKKDKVEIIKPQKEKDSIVNPILYLILGLILTFKSNEAIELIFYVIGIIIIMYGVKALITSYRNKDNLQIKNLNLSIGLLSTVCGVALCFLANFLNLGIRYVIGFFMIFIGISRLLTDFSLSNRKITNIISNIVLIVLGIFSIFVSNAVLVIIGIILLINSVLLFIQFFRS